jgi:hypothetical protein
MMFSPGLYCYSVSTGQLFSPALSFGTLSNCVRPLHMCQTKYHTSTGKKYNSIVYKLIFTHSNIKGETEASELDAEMVLLLVVCERNINLLMSFKIFVLRHATVSRDLLGDAR